MHDLCSLAVSGLAAYHGVQIGRFALQPRVLSMVDVSACPRVLDPLRDVAEVVELPANVEVLRDRIGSFDAYLAPLAVRVDREVLMRAKRLLVIATGATGTDHVDLDVARQRGVTILSLKGRPRVPRPHHGHRGIGLGTASFGCSAFTVGLR
jgi:hypothetical protein